MSKIGYLWKSQYIVKSFRNFIVLIASDAPIELLCLSRKGCCINIWNWHPISPFFLKAVCMFNYPLELYFQATKFNFKTLFYQIKNFLKITNCVWGRWSSLFYHRNVERLCKGSSNANLIKGVLKDLRDFHLQYIIFTLFLVRYFQILCLSNPLCIAS